MINRVSVSRHSDSGVLSLSPGQAEQEFCQLNIAELGLKWKGNIQKLVTIYNFQSVKSFTVERRLKQLFIEQLRLIFTKGVKMK